MPLREQRFRESAATLFYATTLVRLPEQTQGKSFCITFSAGYRKQLQVAGVLALFIKIVYSIKVDILT